LQVVPPPPISQPTPNVAPVVAPITDRAAPPEPSRRVTPNRDAGKSDLVPHRARRRESTNTRGQIIDMMV
jgi:hypothetical protein